MKKPAYICSLRKTFYKKYLIVKSYFNLVFLFIFIMTDIVAANDAKPVRQIGV
jgi:hypothetical protein